MAQNIFGIDGVYYYVMIPQEGIKRSFNVTDTDNAGRAITGEMIRDIIGTYYNYTIEIYPIKGHESAYYDVYNILSYPKDSHNITVPYNNKTITFKAYVTSGEDTLMTVANGNKWNGLSVNFIAVEPQIRPNGVML